MDGRKQPIFIADQDEPVDANAAPVMVQAHRGIAPDDAVVADSIESRFVAFCNDPQQVNQGFALALRVMGFDAGPSGGEVSLYVTNPNRETTR